MSIYKFYDNIGFLTPFFLLVVVIIGIIIFLIISKQDKSFRYITIFASLFLFIFSWQCYNYLLYYYYLETDTTELVEGEIEELTREYWNIHRAAQEQIKVKNIVFSYRKNDNGFYPSYRAQLPDSVLYKGKYVIIKYIVQGDRNLILGIAEK